MDDILVSIIVPVYNVEKYIAKCIESIISQTYKNIEIILINDGSTDKSGEICKKYALQDNRIQLVNNINRGVSHARNEGIKLANSAFKYRANEFRNCIPINYEPKTMKKYLMYKLLKHKWFLVIYFYNYVKHQYELRKRM